LGELLGNGASDESKKKNHLMYRSPDGKLNLQERDMVLIKDSATRKAGLGQRANTGSALFYLSQILHEREEYSSGARSQGEVSVLDSLPEAVRGDGSRRRHEIPADKWIFREKVISKKKKKRLGAYHTDRTRSSGGLTDWVGRRGENSRSRLSE